MKKNPLNFGCGTHAPENWINIDSSYRVLIDKIPFLESFGYKKRFSPKVKRLSVLGPLPFENASSELIYSSHMIEHLTFDEAQFFIQECFRVLAPGGRIRLLTPNLFLMVGDYLARRGNPELRSEAANHFMDWLGAFEKKSPSKLKSLLYFGRNKNLHQWIYDENSLALLLTQAGFKNVQSGIGWITDFPDLDKLEPAELVENSTCAEGYKP